MMLQLLLAVQVLLSAVIESKSSVHEKIEVSTAPSAQTQPRGLHEEYTVKDYCASYKDFYCVKTKQFICIRAGMCMTGPSRHIANSSREPKVVAGLCPYFPHESSLCL